MGKYKRYTKKGVQLMRSYILGEDTTGWSISEKDTLEIGGMVAKDDRIFRCQLQRSGINKRRLRMAQNWKRMNNMKDYKNKNGKK